ncbi:alpha-1,3-galactosyltransferase 2-like [Megalops cyprinoides]|uniref:alpha-1,3-galactosyltransferase 2-like n=1 Tax=Megalops cyprinoides TaxID=118141 RepID=UPI001863BC32|nr:alpha-1,3-galactosyltransferase 2-like [Megalops cyprinoides]XP_036390307.1 alpha-1,3-galactosyltransferase 2-like [Megalops cyprinoides]
MRLCLRARWLFILFVLLLIVIGYISKLYVRFFGHPVEKCLLPPNVKLRPGNHIDNSLDLWSRTDVKTCTFWGAPIMWEGMFDPHLYDEYHKNMGTSVALTVFAIGRYLKMYLKDFLTSAEQHFMVGLPVTYYVFTDAPDSVPAVELGTGRTLEIVQVQRHERWQDVSMMRMRTIADAIDSRIRLRHQYVFCLDVDQVFAARFGSEALGESVALLHAFFYLSSAAEFTYDRNPNSTACMETGDFYYHAAVFGGTWQSVKKMTESCDRGIMTDKKNQVEALWQDESHLNKYLYQHKPSKVLSPEYCWSTEVGYRRDVRVHRLLWAEKYYDILRT